MRGLSCGTQLAEKENVNLWDILKCNLLWKTTDIWITSPNRGGGLVNLDNYEDPGKADGNKESADHGHGSGVQTEAKQCDSSWKTLKRQPQEDLEALGKVVKIRFYEGQGARIT